ncbi:MAG TPA: PAS-domain containing protein [Rhizomicrobium sp.]|nr:PAS-domain containing protein [Rhizomicrobium sp.]
MPQPVLASPTENLGPAITAGAVALAIAASVWATFWLTSVNRLRRAYRAYAARATAAVAARDAIIGAGHDAVVVLAGESEGRHSYGGGDVLLDSCLGGAEAAQLSEAIESLSQAGVPFALEAHTPNGETVHVRGRPVGPFAAIWLNKKSADPDFSAVLDALPIPVWVRDKCLALVWGNRAFAHAAGKSDPSAAVDSQAILEKSERDLAASAASAGHAVESKRFAIIGGQRRALALIDTPLPDGHVAGIAIDITDVANAEAKLQQHVDAHADTLDRLATAVAIFGRDQRLTFYNRAFAQLWGLPESWLDAHPGDGEILDRLREARRLPEQRDYQTWKHERLALYDQSGSYLPEELWHLPGGKTLRVVAQPHPFGGLTYLYEDVTEKIALESSYNTLIKVQRATLDSLGEGVAVFGPDGKLKLHNAAFAALWQLSESDLAGEPHVQRLGQICAKRFGEETAWETLAGSVSSGLERRRDWGEMERSDRTIVSVSLAPLPDGATLVTFADVTDRFRIENALRERNDALEAADRLKSDFVHHASFLFRDPLNAVHGFAELLSAGHAGALSEKQSEYVKSILTASDKLGEITSDILDLAMIDSGTMQLELGRVDIFELLTRVAEPLRQHAESLDIAFLFSVPPDLGVVLLDQRRIRQVVFNLLSNAFKFTPRGGQIVLGAQIVDDDVQIYVSDNGPGIPADVKANVFERFAAKGRPGQRAGAGLGLALVNRFIELHDGWVELETVDGRGTLVRCHLPRRPQESIDGRDKQVA